MYREKLQGSRHPLSFLNRLIRFTQSMKLTPSMGLTQSTKRTKLMKLTKSRKLTKSMECTKSILSMLKEKTQSKLCCVFQGDRVKAHIHIEPKLLQML